MTNRDFAVAVVVVRNNCVLLHRHERLNRWLPPGGHIEPNELPDEAAIREVLEETGVEIRLVGDQLNTVERADQPRQLIRPLGIQLARIRNDHEHIDLIYLAQGLSDGDARGIWFRSDQLAELELSAEVKAWCQIALDKLPGTTEA